MTEEQILKAAASIKGKRSAAKRKLDPDFKKKMSELGKKGAAKRWENLSTNTLDDNEQNAII